MSLIILLIFGTHFPLCIKSGRPIEVLNSFKQNPQARFRFIILFLSNHQQYVIRLSTVF